MEIADAFRIDHGPPDPALAGRPGGGDYRGEPSRSAQRSCRALPLDDPGTRAVAGARARGQGRRKSAVLPGEEANDPAFGAALVEGHDFYVNDAFGASHRAHASIVYPPTVLPSAAGRLLRAELGALAAIMGDPVRPFSVVIGGTKVADKVGMLGALARKADRILIGGAMALTFLAAAGRPMGDSPIEADQLENCRSLLHACPAIELPSDLVAARNHAEPGADDTKVFTGTVPEGWVVRDIGPETVRRFIPLLEGSASVLWNGPMGVFEDPRFADGTQEIALAISRCRGTTVVGGGDTVSAVRALGLAGCFSHLSSGGGAMLQLVEDGDLPGLAALRLGHPAGLAPLT